MSSMSVKGMLSIAKSASDEEGTNSFRAGIGCNGTKERERRKNRKKKTKKRKN
jgi:hypothetical protein